MKIPALSIWQPWASLIAQGHKQYETRSWGTNYRGEILICAARRVVAKEVYHHINWQLRDVGERLTLEPKDFPLGVAVAIANLSGCFRTDYELQKSHISSKEICLGDWSHGRFVWKLTNVQPLQPFPVRGQQGIFHVEVNDELIAV